MTPDMKELPAELGALVNCVVVDRVCEECGKPFQIIARSLSRATRRFCCDKCLGAHFVRKRSGVPKRNDRFGPLLTLEGRFWSYVTRRGDDECWAWTGFKHRGYGRLHVGKGTMRAHRISYQIHVGQIPPGMTVLHSCDNPECTNPAHLSLGTNADNNLDRDRKGRTARGMGNGRSRYTPALVRAMRAARKSGSTWKQLAHQFNASKAGVRSAVSGRTWGHIV